MHLWTDIDWTICKTKDCILTMHIANVIACIAWCLLCLLKTGREKSEREEGRRKESKWLNYIFLAIDASRWQYVNWRAQKWDRLSVCDEGVRESMWLNLTTMMMGLTAITMQVMKMCIATCWIFSLAFLMWNLKWN